jgi:hypothetical protein
MSNWNGLISVCPAQAYVGQDCLRGYCEGKILNYKSKEERTRQYESGTDIRPLSGMDSLNSDVPCNTTDTLNPRIQCQSDGWLGTFNAKLRGGPPGNIPRGDKHTKS